MLSGAAADGKVVGHYGVAPGAWRVPNHPNRGDLFQQADRRRTRCCGKLLDHGACQDKAVELRWLQFTSQLIQVGNVNDLHIRPRIAENLFCAVKRIAHDRHRRQRAIEPERGNRNIPAGQKSRDRRRPSVGTDRFIAKFAGDFPYLDGGFLADGRMIVESATRRADR